MSPDSALRWVRYGPWILVLALIGFGAFHSLHGKSAAPAVSEHAEGLDDAYISYRYAQNWAQGDGLVFNPGERVEGYSNLLWVLIAGLFLHVVPAIHIHWVMVGLSLLLACAGTLLLYDEVRRRAGPGPALGATSVWVCLPVQWLWISSGMETIAVTVVQIGLWWTICRFDELRRPRLVYGFLLTLAVGLRTDGFVLVAILAVHWALHQRWDRVRSTLLLAIPAIVGLFGFRLFYYDDFWPNTYYVKVSQALWQRLSASGEMLKAIAFTSALAPFLLLVLWAAARRFAEGRSLTDRLRLPIDVTLPLGILAYWLYVGGDHFGIRFLLIFYPLALCILFTDFVRGLTLDRRAVVWLAMIVLCLGLFVRNGHFRYRADRYDSWIDLGVFIGRTYPGEWIAAESVGKIPFFSGSPAIDMLGLTDAHIARQAPIRDFSPGHDKGDPEYVLSRRPRLIVGSLGPTFRIGADMDAELYRPAGYRLAYLVNTSSRSRPGRDVLQLPPDFDPSTVRLRILEGYRYGILLRDAD